MSTKAQHRAHLKAHREALPSPARSSWSQTIGEHLHVFCQDRGISRLGAFWPLDAEVDLCPAISAHPHWFWFFPRVAATDPPRLAWGHEPLERGPWGLMEPAVAPHDIPPVQLLLVPGLAFDGNGHRLGYGRGFYDALLPQLPKDVLTMGVGFEAQMGHPVPVEPHDRPVQALLSEAALRLLPPTFRQPG